MQKVEYLILCTNIDVFWNNNFHDKNHCLNYPGSLSLFYLYELCKKHNIDFISEDVAIKSNIDYSKALIIQDTRSTNAKFIIKRGATPFIISCFESPLFAFLFYDFLSFFSKGFRFKWTFSSFKSNQMNDSVVYFPSFSVNDIGYNLQWSTRKNMVLVAANKTLYSPMPKGNLKTKSKWFIKSLYKLFSPSYIKAKKNELHSKRIEAIIFFGSIGSLDLFGKFWDDKTKYSLSQLIEIKSVIDNLNPMLCTDKHKTISNYKFAICFENCALNGYLTEKIIDCFYSGVIPIYLGATNINDLVPKDSFIDMRNFSSFESLNNYLKNLSFMETNQMINRGKEFLKSSEGFKYSYEYYAKSIIEKI